MCFIDRQKYEQCVSAQSMPSSIVVIDKHRMLHIQAPLLAYVNFLALLFV
jgi:hypothetical protein